MLYYFNKGKNTTEMQKKKKICAVYGEGAVTDQMCRKWSAKFRAGDFPLDNAPRSGRPAEVDSGISTNCGIFKTWNIIHQKKDKLLVHAICMILRNITSG